MGRLGNGPSFFIAFRLLSHHLPYPFRHIQQNLAGFVAIFYVNKDMIVIISGYYVATNVVARQFTGKGGGQPNCFQGGVYV